VSEQSRERFALVLPKIPGRGVGPLDYPCRRLVPFPALLDPNEAPQREVDDGRDDIPAPRLAVKKNVRLGRTQTLRRLELWNARVAHSQNVP
jgi:hypothetical protein